MRFQLPDGSEFELTDAARRDFDVDNGVTLLAEAERFYIGVATVAGDANCLIVAARAMEMREIAERAIRFADYTAAAARMLSAQYASTGDKPS